MYLTEFLILENLYFAINFMKLPALEPKLLPFTDIFVTILAAILDLLIQIQLR